MTIRSGSDAGTIEWHKTLFANAWLSWSICGIIIAFEPDLGFKSARESIWIIEGISTLPF